MACHRCPDDDEMKCAWCCPDPKVRARLEAEEDALRAKYNGPRKMVPIEMLCDAARMLEERGVRVDGLPVGMRKALTEHRANEVDATTAETDDDDIDPIFNMHGSKR